MAANALTVDVEDWYHDAEGLGLPAPSRPETRVERNWRRLLELFAEARATATFFVLGEVAENLPGLVRETAALGHEIASHGHRHRPVRALLRREFRDDVRRAKAGLEDLLGAPVAGYRAPYFSIKAGVRWPTDILVAEGFRYDSSILPIDRPPGLEVVTPRIPYALPAGLWEVPVAVPRWLFWNLPLFGGFGLRALPERFVRRRLGEFRDRFGPPVLHVHPWELDASGPEVEGMNPVVRGFKRFGRAGLAARLQRLLAAESFASIASVFPDVTEARTSTPCAQR